MSSTRPAQARSNSLSAPEAGKPFDPFACLTDRRPGLVVQAVFAKPKYESPVGGDNIGLERRDGWIVLSDRLAQFDAPPVQFP